MSNPKKHSFSRLNTFAEICERRSAFDALIPGDWSSTPIKRGNHVHDALQEVAIHMTRGLTAVQAAEIVAQDPPEGYLKQPVLASYLERAVPLFEQLTPMKGKVEEWFESARGLDICGKIDLQSSRTPLFDGSGLPCGSAEGHCVIDHKTIGNPARMKSSYEARKSLQLQIYCLATGARNAGFIYFLPGSAPVRGVMATFDEAQLALTQIWLTKTLDVVDSRWVEAKRLFGVEMNTDLEVKGYNLRPFSLAAPGHALCTAKFCDHWDICLGKGSSPDKEK